MTSALALQPRTIRRLRAVIYLGISRDMAKDAAQKAAAAARIAERAARENDDPNCAAELELAAAVAQQAAVDAAAEIGRGVERQLSACRALCASRGWDVVRVFTENDTSASAKRPGYREMIEWAKTDRADVIVSWAVDRLTRSPREIEDLISLSESTGVLIATVSGDLDLTTDAGRLVGRILGSVARGEVERKGARQKAANMQRAQAGKPPLTRCFGYAKDGTVIEDEARVVRELYSRFLAGAGIITMAREFNERGVVNTKGKAWTPHGLRILMRNPRFIAERWTGQREGTTWVPDYVGPGSWEPLVSVEVFRAANAKLDDPRRKTSPGPTKKHLGSGLYLCGVCGDGTTMRTNYLRYTVKGEGTVHRRTYTCRTNAGHLVRDAEMIDVHVKAEIARYLRQPRHRLATLIAGDDHTAEAAALEAEELALAQRREGIPMALALGTLDMADAQKTRVLIEDMIADVHAGLAELGRGSALTPMLTADDPALYWLDKIDTDVSTAQALAAALCPGGITLHRGTRGRAPFDPVTVTVALPPMIEHAGE